MLYNKKINETTANSWGFGRNYFYLMIVMISVGWSSIFHKMKLFFFFKNEEKIQCFQFKKKISPQPLANFNDCFITLIFYFPFQIKRKKWKNIKIVKIDPKKCKSVNTVKFWRDVRKQMPDSESLTLIF